MAARGSEERGAAADPALPDLVLGTAGHIDHGKTALVKRLTGVDTDRLPEEKARGITLDLGFAPLALPGGLRLGVVDVPGHERLVRTMVAGAAGIDLVLLVVAADEGVMPQTREHLAVCRVLGLGAGVVALSRCDLAEEEVAALAEEEVRALLAGGPLEGAPIVRTSATTGQGLEALRRALAAAARAAVPRTPRAGPPRLWVDRAFEAHGFGTVATGTLVGAPLEVGDTLALLPEGARARVRGLQRFGEPAERVPPGARCAVNLGGVARRTLVRGTLLAPPDALAATLRLDVALEWLPEAPPLGPGTASAELLAGTAERRVRVAPVGAARIAPGEAGLARLHLEGPPLALLPGDRFVLRGFAPTAGGGATLGGGRVLDAAPPRRRRSDPALAAELAELAALRDPAGADAPRALALRVARAGFAGARVDALARETGLGADAVRRRLGAMRDAGAMAEPVPGVLLAREAAQVLEARLHRTLAAFHEADPLRPGMPRAALAGALPRNLAPGVAEALVEGLAARGALAVEGGLVRLPGFAPAPTARQHALAVRLRADAAQAGLEPPTLREWSEALGVAEEELRPVLAHLEREGALVRAPGDLWFDRGAVDALRTTVRARLEAQGALPTTDYKALIGTSRKWAVPLMELFDAEHLTVRRGEARVLRRRPRGAG